ncbi:hypothetical protein GCM10023231_40830 [Olivibacter ginsenosidimutans]|uniref:Nuclear transport factor 2 family protein n=1 Tax=Olivibacter ginsenosidimutans TaxID=1176537 RepID=A0ABP9CAI6_9SPHI
MKTTVNTILTTIAIIASIHVSLAAHPERELNRRAANTTLDQYVATITKGNTNDIDQLFSESFTHKINSNRKLTTHNKKELVDFLKNGKNIEQNCKTAYTVIEENTNYALAKVEMKYENFTKVDYVSLGREGNEWKVSNVVSTYHYE